MTSAADEAAIDLEGSAAGLSDSGALHDHCMTSAVDEAATDIEGMQVFRGTSPNDQTASRDEDKLPAWDGSESGSTCHEPTSDAAFCGSL